MNDPAYDIPMDNGGTAQDGACRAHTFASMATLEARDSEARNSQSIAANTDAPSDGECSIEDLRSSTGSPRYVSDDELCSIGRDVTGMLGTEEGLADSAQTSSPRSSYVTRAAENTVSVLSYADDIITCSPVNPQVVANPTQSPCLSTQDHPIHIVNGTASADDPLQLDGLGTKGSMDDGSVTSELTDDHAVKEMYTLPKSIPTSVAVVGTQQYPREVNMKASVEIENIESLSHTPSNRSNAHLLNTGNASCCSPSSKSSCSARSSRSCSSSEESSLGSVSESSAGTFSTLLSSDSSSRSSLMSSCATDSLNGSIKSNDLTNISWQSIKVRKRCEERMKNMRRISAGSRDYRIYLSRQEELVQMGARNRIAHKRKLSQIRRQSTLDAIAAAKMDSSEVPIAQQLTISSSDSSTLPESSLLSKATPDIGCNTTWNSIPTVRKTNFCITDTELPPLPRPPRVSIFVSLRRALLFERYHTLPGVFAMVMYCIAHISCYEAFATLHSALFYTSNNPKTVYFLTLITGLVVIRFSGLVWNWLNEGLYEGAKFDMHNKLRLGHWDARLLRWIKRRPMTKMIVDICGVYLCFIAVGYFMHEVFMPSVCDMRAELLEALPSTAYPDVPAYTKSLLSLDEAENDDKFLSDTHEKLWDCILADQCCSDMTVSDEELKKALEDEDEQYLFSRLSLTSYYNLFGWEGAALVSTRCTVTFNVVHALLSMAVLFKIGVGFWDD